MLKFHIYSESQEKFKAIVVTIRQRKPFFGHSKLYVAFDKTNILKNIIIFEIYPGLKNAFVASIL